MRAALVSPLPPCPSGIADYSAALLPSLREYIEVDPVARMEDRFEASSYDALIYQIGNNGWHTFVYELALRNPGIVVLHEANLHHLMCDLTIRRNRWDLYVEEAAYNGGKAAEDYARRVQALEVGPDYDNLPMTRRLLEASQGVVVHSRFVGRALREQGYQGPLAVIPHGAWIPEVDRMAAREELGLTETTPLIGIFGHLKPYKRIAESLRAFRRLLRLEPSARMLLCGEVHPEFPLPSIIASLGLQAAVRVTGYTPEEKFVPYLAACDVVLNLRYPTVGETSGTLQRALGLGRAVIVSDIGSFAELPDDVVLKTPVDAREEDLLFEYLHLLVTRPEYAAALGSRAREWVRRECNWTLVARRYADFLQAVTAGAPVADPLAGTLEAPAPPEQPATPVHVAPAYIAGWAQDEEGRGYVETHRTRLERTLELTPPGAPEKSILEMGAYLHITPALKLKLGYGYVRGCYYGPAGKVDAKQVTSEEGESFECMVDNFDAERDRFPYDDASFDTVLCGELIEHLPTDPMFMMAEINRILKPGGHLLLTTPNLASTRALAAILQGYHPGFFPAYLKPETAAEGDARHNREYTPKEIWMLFHYAGFEVVKLETGEFLESPRPQHHWVNHLLKRYGLDRDLRGDGIYCLGRKEGPVRERWPAFLYS